jgi:multidrug efflux system outer membrane protein
MKILSLGVIVSACSLAPDYQRPEAPVPDLWPQIAAGKKETTKASGARFSWRCVFLSPTLQKLIERALVNNRDLRIAALNIQVARSAWISQQAGLLPSINAQVYTLRQRALNPIATPSDVSKFISEYLTTQQATAQSNISFEIDFFGRLMNLSIRSFENYLATGAARSAAQIALIAQVAQTYFALLGDRQSLEISRETARNMEKTYHFVDKRFAQGISSGLERAQARSGMESAHAAEFEFRRQVELDFNLLTLLVGEPLDASIRDSETLNTVSILEKIPPGLPSELLFYRPDIYGAEHQLKAANANIGAARAAFFPSISLTGSGGDSSLYLSKLFSPISGTWSFMPQVTQPLFAGGSLIANLQSSKAQEKIAVAQYEKAIQTAFREVADSLTSVKMFNQQLKAQRANEKALYQAYKIANERYTYGVDSLFIALEQQRLLFKSQQDTVRIAQGRLNAIVDLYKALGGGLI